MGTAATTPDSGTPLSEPGRIFNTFIAPTRTFSDLRRNASWWAPFLLMTVVTLLFISVMDRQIGFDQITRNEIAKSSRADQFEKLPADQKAKQMEISITFTKYISYSTPVFAFIAYLIIAGVLLGIFKFGADASVSFKTALAIVIYGSLPWVIHGLLGVLSMLAGMDKEGFNVSNPVGTNPAYFMDPAGNKFVLGMASAFDVIAIWNIVLVGIGFACNSRVKRSTAIGLVAGTFFVWKLISASLAAVFS